ncbi:hypothetical protein [Nocardia cyriacigeorgica]|uniref:hypothetical protein n=1 Tax=Nocardia cyriacigeorgica TaxID=135487 RepID=UPI002455FB15|nr:hypothetical protein [Nocardia cyriacigeorgica]
MTPTNDPNDTPDLSTAWAALQATAMQLTMVLRAQSAMGWMMRGHLAEAHTVLQVLPADKLLELSAAAEALSSLADELAVGRAE